MSWRSVVGLALGLWVISLCFFALRAKTSGPAWGIELTHTGQGDVVAAAVDYFGAAWIGGVRPGDVITSIDGVDPRELAQRELTSQTYEIKFIDQFGSAHCARPAMVDLSLLGALSAVGLLFATLGGLVYRWSADAALGRLFLLHSGSAATVVLAAPAALLGYAWAGFLAGAAGLLAASGLFGLFLFFPRPVRQAHTFSKLSVTVACSLALASAVGSTVRPDVAPTVETAEWGWLLLNLAGALLLASLRIMRGADRARLSPVLIGTAIGIGPVVLLNAVPRIFATQFLLPPEIVMVCIGAIPISFAYSILRHQVFGLDVLMRGALRRVTTVIFCVASFLVGWRALEAAGLDVTEAALLSVAVAGLVVPTLARWSHARIDAWLYQPLHRLRVASTPTDSGSLQAICNEIAQRLRHILPIHWAAVVVHDDDVPVTQASRRILGADGQLPTWLDFNSLVDQNPTAASVAPITRLGTGTVLLLAGPPVDGEWLDSIQIEAMKVVARSAAASVEAGLLREEAEQEARFRVGLTNLARDLAAAAAVDDVLLCVTTHAASLLGAGYAGLWREGPEGPRAIVDHAPSGVGLPSSSVREVFATRHPRDADQDWTFVTSDRHTLAFALDDGADEPMVCITRRSLSGARRFSALEERRARELVEHSSGALRRAAEREVLEEQLRHRAFYDSLTGLPNRALFLDRMSHAIARGERLGQELAVLFIDLDRFKVVNDSLGHSAGDELLIQVGWRLRGSLRESDTIARLGGDEFTVLLEGPSALADAMKASDRILATLQDPFVLDEHETFAGASIGIAGGSSIRESGRDLLREADIALYRAKASGRGRYVIFDQRMNHLPAEHLHLESDLHRAIERNELRVHFQPIFSLDNGEITGLEALVRWQHPEKGLVPPGYFIPLAEDTGLIVPIGKWVLDESCRLMREWQITVPSARDLALSVNLSARQFQDVNLMQHVEDALRASKLGPQHLQLEITESVVMQEPEATVFKLNALKRLGIKVAVDDFGTGYSSLAYLKRFPIDVLKIDRAFIGGIAQGEHDEAIVRTVISLARALGLRTTAEGIEDYTQWALLKDLGCDQGQGFVFSRPVSPDAVAELLERSNQAAA